MGVVALAASLACQLCVGAGMPAVDFLFPAGGQRGGATAVLAGGTFPTWPVRIWTDDPGLVFKPGESAGRFQVEIATNVPVGAHLVRFYDAGGSGAPRLFVVGEVPELNEPDSPEQTGVGTEVKTLPVTVNGRLRQPGETDTYLLTLAAGDELRATVVAYALDSPVAARLRLLDSGGRVLGESTNPPPHDPALVCAIREAGTYRLELSPVESYVAEHTAFAPSDAAVYRLPLASVAVPGASETNSAGRVLVEGAPLPDRPYRVSVLEAPPAESPDILRPDRPYPTVDLPCTITGFIRPAGNEDHYSFSAVGDELYHFRLRAGSIGSPLVPVFRVLNGAQLVLAESPPGLDPTLDWVAPGDGLYTLVVADARGGGGVGYGYELDVTAPEPNLTATADEHTLRLRPGQSAARNLAIRRPETYQGLLALTAVGLPAGVQAAPATIPPDVRQATLRLTVADDAPPANQPFRITLLDVTANPPRVVSARAPLRGKYAPTDDLALKDTDTFWLTVLPAEKP